MPIRTYLFFLHTTIYINSHISKAADRSPASHGFTGISARIVMKGADPYCVSGKQRRSTPAVA